MEKKRRDVLKGAEPPRPVDKARILTRSYHDDPKQKENPLWMRPYSWNRADLDRPLIRFPGEDGAYMFLVGSQPPKLWGGFLRLRPSVSPTRGAPMVDAEGESVPQIAASPPGVWPHEFWFRACDFVYAEDFPRVDAGRIQCISRSFFGAGCTVGSNGFWRPLSEVLGEQKIQKQPRAPKLQSHDVDISLAAGEALLAQFPHLEHDGYFQQNYPDVEPKKRLPLGVRKEPRQPPTPEEQEEKEEEEEEEEEQDDLEEDGEMTEVKELVRGMLREWADGHPSEASSTFKTMPRYGSKGQRRVTKHLSFGSGVAASLMCAQARIKETCTVTHRTHLPGPSRILSEAWTSKCNIIAAKWEKQYECSMTLPQFKEVAESWVEPAEFTQLADAPGTKPATKKRCVEMRELFTNLVDPLEEAEEDEEAEEEEEEEEEEEVGEEEAEPEDVEMDLVLEDVVDAD